MSVFTKILRAGEGKKVRAIQSFVPDIDALEPEFEALSDEALRHKTVEFRERLRAIGFKPLDGEAAIVPIIVGETAFAIRFSERLLDEGVFVTGFGFPVVPEGTARVRVQMSAAIEPEHVDRALTAFEQVGRELELI